MQVSSTSPCLDNGNKKMRVRSKGVFYIVVIHGWNSVKIGYWSSTIRKLHARYQTCYGKSFKLITFAHDHHMLLEKLFKVHFKEHQISGELYKHEFVEQYCSFMEHQLEKTHYQLTHDLSTMKRPPSSAKPPSWSMNAIVPTTFETHAYTSALYNLASSEMHDEIKRIETFPRQRGSVCSQRAYLRNLVCLFVTRCLLECFYEPHNIEQSIRENKLILPGDMIPRLEKFQSAIQVEYLSLVSNTFEIWSNKKRPISFSVEISKCYTFWINALLNKFGLRLMKHGHGVRKTKNTECPFFICETRAFLDTKQSLA